MVLDFMNEYSVMKQADSIQLHNIIPLSEVRLGLEHVSLAMPRYEMDYRKYLRTERDPRKLGTILLCVANGLKELHELGYVHRDLKPENIVLNLKPTRARIIDFNRACLATQTSVGHVRGTPGYQPYILNLRDGSFTWDVWALGAIILESDMEKDEYFVVNQERGSIAKATAHLDKPEVCRHLK